VLFSRTGGNRQALATLFELKIDVPGLGRRSPVGPAAAR